MRFDRYKDGKLFAATFSYDDGNVADLKLLEIFNKYGVKGTFNLNSQYYENGSIDIKGDMLKDVYKGHEIACHSNTHPHLEKMPVSMQYEELRKDRLILEELSGRIIRGFAYPFGTYNDDTITAMKTAGLVYGRTTIATNDFTIPTDFRKWNPTCHHRYADDAMDRFVHSAEKCPWRAGLLLYIWGHSYEFNNDGNWDVIENICSRLAALDNVWFATNIDIFDYVNAINSLIVSADCKTVENPTSTDVWVSEAGESVKIPACCKVTL